MFTSDWLYGSYRTASVPGLGRMQFNFGQRPFRYSDDRVLQNRVERYNFGHSQTEKATLYEYLHTNSMDTRFDRWISARSIRLRDRDPCFYDLRPARPSLRRSIGITGNVFPVRSLGRATTRITLHPARNASRSCCYAAIRGAHF